VKSIRYYMVPSSPWTYLGHERLIQIAQRHGATIEVRPFDLGSRVFPVSGGLPLGKRAPQRQAYRLVELPRWSAFLGLELNLHPKYFPVDGEDAARFIIVAGNRHGGEAALAVAGAVLRAVWAQERNIADPATLAAIGDECGLDGAALYAARSEAEQDYDRFTRDALEAGVFGAPWYEYNGEPFWGQDRLDFLERALAAGPGANGSASNSNEGSPNDDSAGASR
jgi:2-hydroxychromene-2-carboxylate isomerase